MRFLFIFLLINTSVYSQQPQCKISDISAMEAGRYQNMFGAARTTASTSIDVHFYNCTWEVDPAIRYIKGSVAVHYKALENISFFILDLMNPLEVDSVKRGDILLLFNHSNNELNIQTASPVQAGTADSVRVFYKGIPPNTGFGSFIQTQHNGTPVMWSLSEPYGSMDWWPCKNGLDDKADSIDIRIIHPDQYKAASNGLLKSESALPGGLTSTLWQHRYPIATYLVCFAVTNYSVFERNVQLGSSSLPMVTYCYPENRGVFEGVIQQVLDQLILFHDTLGAYPFIREKYGHVQFSWGGGMEHQTSTFIVSPDESLVAHELAHQWFGDKITTGAWEDIWLNEGFATHFAAYYMERKYPAFAIQRRAGVVADITSQPGGSVKVNDTTDVGRIFSSRLSYNKGSYLVYMLRLKLGNEAFFNGLRAYLQDPELAYKFARTADLKRHMELASGKDLTTFFDQWFEGEGYPSYQVKWSQMGSSGIKIKINQQTSHPSVSFFQMPVPLRFINGNREANIVLDNTFNGEEYIRNIGFIPDTVLIDPEYWLVSKNNTVVKEDFSTPGNAGIDIYPNPVKGPLTVFLHDIDATAATVILFNSLGQVIFKNELRLVNGAEFHVIDMTKLAKGVYYLKTIAGSAHFLNKIIK